MSYDGPGIAVAITVTSQVEGADSVAEVTSRRDIVGEFALPARVRFRPDNLDRLVCPNDGNQSVGTAFLPTFFQPQARPTSWNTAWSARRGVRVCSAARW
jgi:hypothetical protein